MKKKVKLSTYEDVWVVFRYGDTEIYEVYLDKSIAEGIAKEQNEQYMKDFNCVGKFKVISLYSAISDIAEVVNDNAQEVGEEY